MIIEYKLYSVYPIFKLFSILFFELKNSQNRCICVGIGFLLQVTKGPGKLRQFFKVFPLSVDIVRWGWHSNSIFPDDEAKHLNRTIFCDNERYDFCLRTTQTSQFIFVKCFSIHIFVLFQFFFCHFLFFIFMLHLFLMASQTRGNKRHFSIHGSIVTNIVSRLLFYPAFASPHWILVVSIILFQHICYMHSTWWIGI